MRLHAQPFQVLVMLLEKPSMIVTREEMRERLWGSQTFVDFDHGLNTAVSKVREVLGDSASVPRFVETVAGKGYRFLAPVTVWQPSSDPPNESVAVAAGMANGTAASVSVEPPAHFDAPPEKGAPENTTRFPLTTPEDLPAAPRRLVRILLILIQAMYLGFYFGALSNLNEIHDIFLEAQQAQPGWLMALLITTGTVLIPVRLFLFTAVALDYVHLQAKFAKLFPALLVLDLLWSLSPFLLIHHISAGFALALTAPLVYAPFAQRSLILMHSRCAGERHTKRLASAAEQSR
ncbi:MAG: winged helix-turn-helix domain-containing protein [Bryobacterales bacterium]|nr:winged helix-turn-helix domain-containing protein [Bryobacterales bacterium]MBV9397459.1 winged helix-turn-helix domain-containing protein [Bryobacterales bacterium]